MNDTSILETSAVDLAAQVRAGERSATEISEAFLRRIDAHNGRLGALLSVEHERVRAQAAAVDARRAAGETLGALAGVPVAVKDNLCARGETLTCASKILEGYRPPYDAHVVEKLREADAVMIGRANMDEFAMGSSNEHSAYKPVRNPWDESRAPGGSSGGSAASVAARFAPLALGSDTGGSVRQPGAFCGITALKPTYGRVSRHGLVAFASSLDQVGPMARDARDAAALMQVIAGHDGRDATSSNEPVADYVAACGGDLKGLRIGVVQNLGETGPDASVQQAFEAAVSALEAEGGTVVPVELPHLKYAVATYYLLANAEASSNLARFDGMRYGLRAAAPDLLSTYGETRTQGFGPEVQRRILLGTYALSAGYYDAFYLKAQKVRSLFIRDFANAFERCDVVVTPTAPTPAFGLGTHTADPVSMYLADVYTLPASLAGVPAMNVPAGFSPEGLPLGLQLMARHFDEARLFQVASRFEADHDFTRQSPKLGEGVL